MTPRQWKRAHGKPRPHVKASDRRYFMGGMLMDERTYQAWCRARIASGLFEVPDQLRVVEGYAKPEFLSHGIAKLLAG